MQNFAFAEAFPIGVVFLDLQRAPSEALFLFVVAIIKPI